MAYNELGARVGGAGQQAAAVVAAQVGSGVTQPANIGSEYERLIRGFLGVMERVQAELESGTLAAATPAPTPAVAQQVQQAFPGTSEAAPAAPQAAAPATTSYGYDTTFSGSSKPLKVGVDNLEPWVVAQCQALGIDQVWDNRGKPNYVAAIAAGKAKTPPPFRSATEGIDKSLWPAS